MLNEKKNKPLGYAVRLNQESVSMGEVRRKAAENSHAPSACKTAGPAAESVQSFFASENIASPSSGSAPSNSYTEKTSSPLSDDFSSLTSRLYSEIDRSVQKKRAAKSADIEFEGEDDEEISEPKQLLSPLAKSIIIKTVLGAIILWLGYSIYSANIQRRPFEYEDSFFLISSDRREYERASIYIDFIIKIVGRKGSPGIKGKWLKGIPPQFSEFAGSKIADLALNGYKIQSVSANNDTPNIYKVKCLAENGRIVFFEIVKVKYAGEVIFRLLKVY